MKNVIKKIGQILFCFVPIIITLAIQFAVMIPIAFYYFFILGATGEIPQLGEDPMTWAYDFLLNSDFTVYVTVAWAVVSLLTFFLWYKRKHDVSKDVKVKNTLSATGISGMLLMVVGLQIAIQYLYSILENYFPSAFSMYNELMDMTHYGVIGTMVMLIYGVIIAPIHEEYLNRGITLHYASKAMPFWLANIFQAAIFGVLHMNLVQGSYAFIAGVVLGFVYKEGKNIWIPILFHMAFNLFGVIVPLMPLAQEKTSAYALAGILGVVVMVSGIVLFKMAIRQREEEL